jgi:Transglycosylase SLT domain
MEMGLRLKAVPPKAWLAVVLVLGFVMTIPVWLASTPEERQQFNQTTTAMQVVEQNTGPLTLSPSDRESLKELLKPEPEKEANDFERTVWMKDMFQLIRPWVETDGECESISRWVYTYSVRYQLSPELILGVIAVESRFDHFAVSNVGARGLMQVMPFWKDQIGSPSDNLFDISTNIRYGCAIIRHYLNRYGKISKALAAYNGSPNDRWYPAKVFAQMKRFKAENITVGNR